LRRPAKIAAALFFCCGACHVLAYSPVGVATSSIGRRDGTEDSSGQFERRRNMTCSQCGSDVVAGSAVCPNCGAQQPGFGTQGAHAQAPPPPAAPTPAPAPQFNFDAKRWTRNDQIVGGATLLLLISLFLPWFSAGDQFISFSVNGLWHGWEYITLIIALAILVYLVLCAGFQELPFKLPFSHDQLLLAGTGINFVLVLLGFLIRPASGFGWSFGAFIGLIAAVVAVLPLGLPFVRARTGRS
jgi:hypothetical protein